MAARPKGPGRGITAAATSLLVAIAWTAPPLVLASPVRNILCDESAASPMHISELDLTAVPVSSSDEALHDNLLKPGIKSAARRAFAEQSNIDTAGDEGADKSEEVPEAEPTIPSASEERSKKMKRQMYRRDI